MDTEELKWTPERKIQADGMTKVAYLTDMSQGAWGGAIEIEALSALLNVKICVWYDDTMYKNCFGSEGQVLCSTWTRATTSWRKRSARPI